MNEAPVQRPLPATPRGGSPRKPLTLPWGRWSLRTVALAYLVLMIAVPLASVVERGFRDGLGAFWSEVSSPIARGALWLTVSIAVLTALINAVMGTLTAFALVRYRFKGQGLLNGLVDLPFAIPTLVTGVMLVSLYGPQRLLGAMLSERGIQVVFATPGIVLALLLVTYPFVVRTVQPVLMAIERAEEDAAYTLGASRRQAILHIVLPAILPAVATGALLSFARALGEFGSIVVVAGNIPGRTLTAPVYIFGQIESENARGASAASVVLLGLSFLLMLAVDWLHRRREVPDVFG